MYLQRLVKPGRLLPFLGSFVHPRTQVLLLLTPNGATSYQFCFEKTFFQKNKIDFRKKRKKGTNTHVPIHPST
jgi:hypothetical protein